MPINITPNLSTSQYEHLVLQALSQIAGPGANISSIPSILSTSDFRHLVLYSLKYIAENGGSAGTAYYGQVSKITSGTINISTAGTYQSTGLTATLDSENFGIIRGTTDLFSVKNVSGSSQLLKIYGSADIEAGNNKILGIKLALNGTPIDNTECNSSTGQGTTFAKLVTNWMIELQPNDEVALYVTNKTNSGNMTLLRGRLVASTVRKVEATPISLLPLELVVACSNETSNLTPGSNKVTFRSPCAFTLTGVRSSVNTAPTGSTLVVDINQNGTSILSTKLSIDVNEKTSLTAATPAVISNSAIADDSELTIDIDQVGSTIAGEGLKIVLIGTRA